MARQVYLQKNAYREMSRKNMSSIMRQRRKETVNIDSKPLQMSVNAAFGVQFDVLDNVGIYAEPGVSYYLDDHSSLQTIYKEKPLNFNLNVGVRYTIGK